MNRIIRTFTILLLFAAVATSVARAAVETHSFTNLNRSIPDGHLSGISEGHSITSSVASISSLRVRLKIEGEFNGDLYGYVRHINAGTTNFCILLNRPGRTASSAFGYADSGLDVVFDDATISGDIHLYRNVITPANGTPLTGDWQPDGRKVDPTVVTEASLRTTTLGSFAGANASGEWTLYLVDAETGGTNMLKSWALEINGTTTAPITWSTPADIVYGMPLGAAQLNATSSVAGTFTYDPPTGTVLNAGAAQTLAVTFTPLDTANHLPVTTNVGINVLPKDLTITADNKTNVYGASLPAFTATYDGFVNGDTPASLDVPVMLATTATNGSPVGTYAITASGAADANYTITFVDGTLTITPSATAGLLTSSANPALPGSAVVFTFSASTLPPGSGTPVGPVQFKINGTNAGLTVALTGGIAALTNSTLTVGLHQISAEYAGSLNFQGTTNILTPDQMINTPPVAGADMIERWPTNGTKISVAALLANDSDTDGDMVTFVSFSSTSAQGGTLSLTNGWIFYMRPAGFTNIDSFTYTISDGRGVPVTGTVTITIKVNTMPSPNLAISSLGNGSYLLRFDGIPGVTYRIEFAEDVISSHWQPLGGGTANESGTFEFVDTPPQGAPQRYYRSVYP